MRIPNGHELIGSFDTEDDARFFANEEVRKSGYGWAYYFLLDDSGKWGVIRMSTDGIAALTAGA